MRKAIKGYFNPTTGEDTRVWEDKKPMKWYSVRWDLMTLIFAVGMLIAWMLGKGIIRP